jgi:hypothetical protein
MQTLTDEKEQLSAENQDFMKRKAKLELDIKDMQDEVEGDRSAKVRLYALHRICCPAGCAARHSRKKKTKKNHSKKTKI